MIVFPTWLSYSIFYVLFQKLVCLSSSHNVGWSLYTETIKRSLKGWLKYYQGDSSWLAFNWKIDQNNWCWSIEGCKDTGFQIHVYVLELDFCWESSVINESNCLTLNWIQKILEETLPYKLKQKFSGSDLRNIEIIETSIPNVFKFPNEEC